MIMALRQLGRPDGRTLYYKDRQNENTWGGGTAEWLQDGYRDVNQRASYFQVAYSSASAMVMHTLGAGSNTLHDQGCEGRIPQRVEHLQAAPAAKSAGGPVLGGYCLQCHRRHDAGDAAAPSIDQRLERGSHQQRRLRRSLVQAIEAGERAGVEFIQTVSGRNFLVALRLYGTGVEFFDQTWKPDDLVKVE